MRRSKCNAREVENRGNAVFTEVQRPEFHNAWRIENACGDIRIGAGADWVEFANCDIDPFRVMIPGSVRRILAKCAMGLKDLYIDESKDPNAWLSVEVSGSERLTSINLPEHVIRVDAHYCHALKHLTLPKRFEWADFYQCRELTGLDMPPSPSALKYINVQGSKIKRLSVPKTKQRIIVKVSPGTIVQQGHLSVTNF